MNDSLTSLRDSQQQAQALAVSAAHALDCLKASDINVLDLRERSDFADYFVIATGSTPLHMRALEDRVEERLRLMGARPHHVEGRDGERWILMDYFGVVVHVFSQEGRAYYGLERLWGDAESVEWQEAQAGLAHACAS